MLAAALVGGLFPATAAPLPSDVTVALERAKLPREALVAVVQEVDSTRPRLAWQPDRPVNPASLMKLLTTFSALELLGPAWSWSTPVWLQAGDRLPPNCAAMFLILSSCVWSVRMKSSKSSACRSWPGRILFCMVHQDRKSVV